MKLLNAISLNMFSLSPEHDVRIMTIQMIDVVLARTLLSAGIESFVGHEDTAKLLGGLLGLEVPCRRETCIIAPGERCVVGQYRGPRLPDGVRSLPEGAIIDWIYLVG